MRTSRPSFTSGAIRRQSGGWWSITLWLRRNRFSGPPRFSIRRALVGSVECDRGAVAFQRARSSLEDSDQFQPFVPTGHRLRALLNTVQKMLAFGFEWFLLFEMRNVAVSVVIREVEIGEGIVMRRPLNAHIINADLLVRLQIIIN